VVGAFFGNYRAVEKLREGGMGAVYLAEHVTLGRKAAVKVLLPAHGSRPDLMERLFTEARALANLSHPALVDVFDYGVTADGAAYLVMEYLPGETLAERLARGGPLPVADALELGRQIASGVGAAHAQGIVHRDLKPDNVILVPDPEVPGRERVKILDFGVAKLMTPSLRDARATQPGLVVGTPDFMAPEQSRGCAAVDHRADVYALGCLLYAALVGRPPFPYGDVGSVLAAHQREPVTAPRALVPRLPAAVEAVVLRALEKRPEARFQSMDELGRALAALAAEGAASDPRGGRGGARGGARGRPGGEGGGLGHGATGLAALAVALAAGAVLVSFSRLELRGAAAPGPTAPAEATGPAEALDRAATRSLEDRAPEGGPGQGRAAGRKPRPVLEPPIAGARAGERERAGAPRPAPSGDEPRALVALRAQLERDGLPAARRREAEQKVLALQKKLAEIEVRSDVPGLAVSVNGEPRGRTPLRAPIVVRPGKHELVLTGAGVRPVRKVFDLDAGERRPFRFTRPR
jgi:serine/threonine-protein kinase